MNDYVNDHRAPVGMNGKANGHARMPAVDPNSIPNITGVESWRIGFVGLGKLGMPVALALSLKGHDVMGFDVDPNRMRKDQFPHREIGPNGEPSIEPLLAGSSLGFGTIDDVVRHAEVIFIAIQTPHDPRYEGATRLPEERVDFEYGYLREAVRRVAEAIERNGQDRIVVIISTVLPGTIHREIVPVLNRHVKLCYNPFFIAMGTTITDFLNPEFVLFGVWDSKVAQRVRSLYGTLHSKPFYETSIENAELIKVAYNTYITMKICYSNTLMEICHKIPGCDVDQVTNALALANERLLSPRYMRAGMGDGGGCHPRDNIALSWLARKLDLSYDWFENVMVCRENQTEFLANLIAQHHAERGYSRKIVGIYGRSFKAQTNLTVGSPATLLANILEEQGFEVRMFDPYLDPGPCPFDWPGVYFVATNHKEFAQKDFRFPQGSVVLDPWRFIPEREGVSVIHVGVGKTADEYREISQAVYAGSSNAGD